MCHLFRATALLLFLLLMHFNSLANGKISRSAPQPVVSSFGISLYLDSHHQAQLPKLATHYLQIYCPQLVEVNVISNSPLESPLKDSPKKTSKKYYNSVYEQHRVRQNRFKPNSKSQAKIYLVVSKVLRLTCSEMLAGFRKYQQNVIVEGHFGPIVTYYASSVAPDKLKLSYVPKSTGLYNFAVDAFFASRHHMQLFDISLSSAQRFRKIVRDAKECEQLALNFIVAHFYPELTTIKLKSQISGHQQGSPAKDHSSNKSSEFNKCINSMMQAVGSLPSRYLHTDRQMLYQRADFQLIAQTTHKNYQYYQTLIASKKTTVTAKPDRNDKLETFGILTVTYTRRGHNEVFMDHLKHYATMECPSLTQINIIWNNKKSPNEMGVFKQQATWKRPVNFLRTSFNSILHRFHRPEASKQQYQLSLDDDIRLTCQQMVQLLKLGLNNVVGKTDLIPLTSYMGRRVRLIDGKFNYYSGASTKESYNLGITNAAILHTHHMQLFYINQPKINGIRKYVEILGNCEDIAINFIVNYFYPQLDILVHPSNRGQHAQAKRSYGGISSKPNHQQNRTKCLNAFTRILGQASFKETLHKKAPERSDADLVSEVVSSKVQYYDQIMSRPNGSKRDSEKEKFGISQVSRQVIHQHLGVLLSAQVSHSAVENYQQETLKKESNSLVKKEEHSKVQEENQKLKSEIKRVNEENSKLKEDSVNVHEVKPELDQLKQFIQMELKKETQQVREIVESKQPEVKGGIWQINGWTYFSCALALIIILVGFRWCRHQRQNIEHSSIVHKVSDEAKDLSINELSERSVNVVQS